MENVFLSIRDQFTTSDIGDHSPLYIGVECQCAGGTSLSRIAEIQVVGAQIFIAIFWRKTENLWNAVNGKPFDFRESWRTSLCCVLSLSICFVRESYTGKKCLECFVEYFTQLFVVAPGVFGFCVPFCLESYQMYENFLRTRLHSQCSG